MQKDIQKHTDKPNQQLHLLLYGPSNMFFCVWGGEDKNGRIRTRKAEHERMNILPSP